MTRDDIIRMAWEAGAIPIHGSPKEFALSSNQRLERFAALVAAAEREECAKVCDAVSLLAGVSWKRAYLPEDQGRGIGADECAAAIRARGSQ